MTVSREWREVGLVLLGAPVGNARGSVGAILTLPSSPGRQDKTHNIQTLYKQILPCKSCIEFLQSVFSLKTVVDGGEYKILWRLTRPDIYFGRRLIGNPPSVRGFGNALAALTADHHLGHRPRPLQ